MQARAKPSWPIWAGIMVAAGIAGTAYSAGDDASADTPMCRIEATSRNSGVALEALVRTGPKIGGAYRFSASKVGGGGSSQVDQSGEFVGTGGWSSVGQIELGGSGPYEARLSVEVGGRTVQCRKSGGGRV